MACVLRCGQALVATRVVDQINQGTADKTADVTVDEAVDTGELVANRVAGGGLSVFSFFFCGRLRMKNTSMLDDDISFLLNK